MKKQAMQSVGRGDTTLKVSRYNYACSFKKPEASMTGAEQRESEGRTVDLREMTQSRTVKDLIGHCEVEFDSGHRGKALKN